MHQQSDDLACGNSEERVPGPMAEQDGTGSRSQEPPTSGPLVLPGETPAPTSGDVGTVTAFPLETGRDRVLQRNWEVRGPRPAAFTIG
jgi:hypothetical protein